MERISDIFRRGKVSFENVCQQLFEMYKILPLKARKELFGDKNKKIVNDWYAPAFLNMRRDFNCLLQYALLDIATTGPKNSYLEMLYIADIGDIEADLSKNPKEDKKGKSRNRKVVDIRVDHTMMRSGKKIDKKLKVTYFMLTYLGPEDTAKYKALIYSYIEPIYPRIMKTFQIINQLSKGKKVINYILNDLYHVYLAFLDVDGRLQREDPSAVGVKMKEFFFDHIDDYKNKVKGLLK